MDQAPQRRVVEVGAAMHLTAGAQNNPDLGGDRTIVNGRAHDADRSSGDGTSRNIGAASTGQRSFLFSCWRHW
jgi:hypothetical protein